MDGKVTRRVYHRELQTRTGWGPTWIRTLEKTGKIPPGRVDEGGKRKWWTEPKPSSPEQLTARKSPPPLARSGNQDASQRGLSTKASELNVASWTDSR